MVTIRQGKTLVLLERLCLRGLNAEAVRGGCVRLQSECAYKTILAGAARDQAVSLMRNTSAPIQTDAVVTFWSPKASVRLDAARQFHVRARIAVEVSSQVLEGRVGFATVQ